MKRRIQLLLFVLGISALTLTTIWLYSPWGWLYSPMGAGW